jgi:enoyl-CoA hydratase
MKYSCFEVHIQNQVAHLQLNQPDRHNCMTREFWQELPEALWNISDNALARVVVISSTGKHFSSGLDVSVFADVDQETDIEKGRQGESLMQTLKQFQQAFTTIEQIRLPVLVAVQGGCIGGGLDMVSACDSRYCTEDAYFTVMETKIAMTADVGTLQRLQHVLPSGMARELAYTGRKMTASEALQFGLVNRVYPNQQSMIDSVLEIAGEIAANSPLSVYGCKEMLNYAREHTVADSLNYQAVWQAGMFHFDDMQEAFAARAENRNPVYPDLSPVKKGG